MDTAVYKRAISLIWLPGISQDTSVDAKVGKISDHALAFFACLHRDHGAEEPVAFAFCVCNTSHRPTKKAPAKGRLFRVSDPQLVDHGQQLVQRLLGVAIEHAGVLFVEQRVFDTGVTRALPPLADDDLLGLPHFKNRHPRNG